ncbi:MAG: OmpA family protein [Bdellovibrionota bacterium]
MNTKSPILMTAISSILFLACGGKNLEVSKISTTSNPNKQIASLEAAVTSARNEQVNVLSPTWFGKANASLEHAKQLQKNGDDLREIFDSVATGQAEIKKAESTAKITRTTIPDALTARKDALEAGAATLQSDFNAAEENFMRLTKEVEEGNVKWARGNQERVAQQYRDVELKAIKEQALGQARKIIDEAVKRDARKIVPETLKVAQEKLAQADAFISENRYDKDQLLSKANEALFYAQRLQAIYQYSVAVQKRNPEQVALLTESMLASIAKTAEAQDMRDQSFKTQVDNINGKIEGLQKDQQFLVAMTDEQSNQISLLRSQVSSLEGMTKAEQEAKEKLEAEKEFNRLYGEVRNYFNTEEAEVYKQGDQLLIRLKAMKFPVGQSVIMPTNYPLLTKVQKAIRVFGKPQVTIEGHTDTTGSKALNEHLSQERAESVKEYFIANQTLTENYMSSVGYGDAKPVAPNNTAEGRAQNRRIDVVISPTQEAN